MTIKAKLSCLILVTIIAIGAVYSFLHMALDSVGRLKDAQTVVSELESSMLTLRRHEKDFLARDDAKYLGRFDETIATFQQQLMHLGDLLDQSDIDSSQLEALDQVLLQYQKHFKAVADTKAEIGLSHEEGLRGNLRKAVQGAEGRVNELGYHQLVSGILQLRRNEKDFLLRKDLKYRDKFEKNFSKLDNDIAQVIGDPNLAKETRALLKAYREGFLALVGHYEKLGLSSKEGLFGQMRTTIHQSETLLTEQEQIIGERLQESTDNILLFSAIKSLVLATVIALIALWIARDITSRLNALKKVMSSARDDKDLTLRYTITSKDELSDMGRSFNSMMEEFQSLLDDVSKSSLSLSSSAEEVSAIAADTSKGLEDQKHEVSQVSSAVREMKNAMHEISHNTDLTAQTATSSQASANEGQGIINQTITNINQLADEASQSTTAVQLLEENSNRIGTVLDVIKTIAEQTNLLALNASIEAARAGEQGRGFSVVADEVRALAGRSQSSATEIEEMVIALQQQTEKVSGLMQRSVELSSRSADEASGTINALAKINEDANSIVDMTTQVASAIEEQAAVASEIDQNAERIQAIVEVANEQVGQNALASEEVAQQAAHLREIVSRFKLH